MALTSEQMQKIVVAELTGKEQTVKGKEAEEFLKKTKKEIADAKKQGLEVQVPAEWEVDTDGEL